MAQLSDSQTASIVLLIGGIGLGLWWYRLDPTERASVLEREKGEGPRMAGGPVPGRRTAADPYAAERKPVSGSPMARLEAFAAKWGLTVTSRTRKGNPRSMHYFGRAIDTSRGRTPRETAQIIADAIQSGFRVLDENYRGYGRWGYSSGPHLHIEDRR